MKDERHKWFAAYQDVYKRQLPYRVRKEQLAILGFINQVSPFFITNTIFEPVIGGTYDTRTEIYSLW